MKKILFTLIIPLLSLGFYNRQPSDPAHDPGLVEEAPKDNEIALEYTQAAAEIHCINPNPEDVKKCHDLEEDILSATVQLIFRSRVVNSQEEVVMYESISHATVKDGRFLVTHNHFATKLSIFPDTDNSKVTTSLMILDRKKHLIFSGSLDEFYVHHAADQVLVLDHKTPKSPRWLEELGLNSAEFVALQQSNLQPGLEIAQLDWDGVYPRIDWTVIDEVRDGGKLILDDAIKVGSSGGGVFLNGMHIANNAALVIKRNPNGQIADLRSSAMLNQDDLLLSE